MLYQHATHMPNTDCTDYTDYRVGYIISENDVNVIPSNSVIF